MAQRGKGVRPEDVNEAAAPGANFSLLARLAVLSTQQQQVQLQRLPGGGDAFNTIATKAMRESKQVPPPHDSSAEERCRKMRPEHLLPKDLPLPPHGSEDPLNVAKTLTFGVRASLRTSRPLAARARTGAGPGPTPPARCTPSARCTPPARCTLHAASVW